MRLNFCAAAWVVVALCSACRSRALPAPDDAGIPEAQGGGGTGGAADGRCRSRTAPAALRGRPAARVSAVSPGRPLEQVAQGAGGAAGSAGLGGAGVTTGGGGRGREALSEAAGRPHPGGHAGLPARALTGRSCAAVGSACRSTSFASPVRIQYWRLVSQGPCVCNPTGVWMRQPVSPGGGPIGDCFFDPPLDCVARAVAVRGRHLPDAPTLRGGNASLGGGG